MIGDNIMKLLFENWRKYITEVEDSGPGEDPDDDSDDAAELRNMVADMEQAGLPQLKHIEFVPHPDNPIFKIAQADLNIAIFNAKDEDGVRAELDEHYIYPDHIDVTSFGVYLTFVPHYDESDEEGNNEYFYQRMKELDQSLDNMIQGI